MTDKKLPEKAVPAVMQIQPMVALALMTCMLMWIAAVGTLALLDQHYIFAAVWFAALLASVWSVGSLYLTVPLTVSFLSKYYNERNYVAIDMEHTKTLKLLNTLPFYRRPDTAGVLSNLGLVRLCQGYYQSAEDLFLEADKLIAKHRGFKDSIFSIVILNNLAVTAIRLKKYVEAESYAHRAMEIALLPKNVKKHKVLVAAPTAALSLVRYKWKEYDQAEEKLKEALELYESNPVPAGMSPRAFEQAKVLANLGMAMCCLKQNRVAESEQWCDKAFGVIHLQPTVLGTLALEGLLELANDYMNLQMYQRAERLLEIAYRIGQGLPVHPDAKLTLKFYEKLLLLTDRGDEVQDMQAWLRSNETGMTTT